MLFSILIGAAATFYFLARALVIKMKTFVSGGRNTASDGISHPYIIYSENKRYWSVFKPVLEAFENNKTEVLYLASSEDDPVFQSNFQFVKSDYIGEGNRAFARLNLLSAKVVLMTTPGLNVYQLKRSKMVKHYAHILHAPSDATMYRMFGIDYFDSVLLTGDYQAMDIRQLEKTRNLPEKQLVTVGCTYLDVYLDKMKEIPKEKNHIFTVLVSPSWGASAILSLYGEKLLDPLVRTGWRIIVRPHPQSRKSEPQMLEALAKKYSEFSNLEWDYEPDNIKSLVKADIMISDFSGIVFDYAFLCDKPIIYVKQGFDLRPYDADDLTGAPWQFSILTEIGIELKEEYFNAIGDVIRQVADNAELKAARQKAKETAWQCRGKAGENVFGFMTGIK
jgi:CDP-glycerol glycerophosphotransferase (TagB/SpsB family)